MSIWSKLFSRDAGKEEARQSANPELNKLNDLIDRMIEAAQPVTDQWIARWDQNYNYAFNNQLSGKKRKNGWPAIQLNMAWPAIKQEVAILAQRKPQIFAEPMHEEHASKAKWWSGDLQSRFERARMAVKSVHAVYDGALTGWYIGYIYPDKRSYWDSEAQRWVYEPKMTLLNPRFFGMDPNAETMEDAQFVYCQRLVPVEWAIQQWPDMEADIVAEAQRMMDGSGGFADMPLGAMLGTNPKDTVELAGDSTKLAGLLLGYRQETEAARTALATNQDPRAQYVLVTHIYFRDPETHKLEVKEDYGRDELVAAGAIKAVRPALPDGSVGAEVYVVDNPDAPEMKNCKSDYKAGDLLQEDDWPQHVVREVEDAPKYPNGRCVYRINNLILNPKDEAQVWDRRRWPFEIGIRMPLPHVPQGLDAIEMMRIAQDWVNVSASHLMNYLQYFGDPVTIVEEGALPKGEKGKLRSVAGAVWHVVSGGLNKIQRESAPQLSQGVLEIFGLVQRHGQDSSLPDVALGGLARKGDPTATEIAATQQAAQVGLGLPMMFLDDWVLRVMRQFAELDKLYLKQGDTVHMAGGEWGDGRMVEFMDEYRDIEFDIKLEVGTALPFDRERKRQELLMLLGGPFANNPKLKDMLLDAFEIRDKKGVLKADAEYQQFLAFQQQLEAMAQQEQAGAAGALPPAPAEEPIPTGV